MFRTSTLLQGYITLAQFRFVKRCGITTHAKRCAKHQSVLAVGDPCLISFFVARSIDVVADSVHFRR